MFSMNLSIADNFELKRSGMSAVRSHNAMILSWEREHINARQKSDNRRTAFITACDHVMLNIELLVFIEVVT